MAQLINGRRIIFIPFIDAFGGVERLALDLARFLHQQNVHYVLACFRQKIDLQSYADWPLPVQEIPAPRNVLREARALAQFLKAARIAGGGRPLLFDLKSAFYSGIAATGPFCLHLTDPPSLLPADQSKHSFSARGCVDQFASLPRLGPAQAVRAELVHRLNRRGARKASEVLVMTERIRRELQQLYQIDARVIRPGVSSPDVAARSEQRVSGRALRMLSVARLEPSKRIDWILRALAALNGNSSFNQTDWLLEVVGQGPDSDSLKRLTAELGLTDRILFLGHVSDVDLARSYSRANLFIMPAVQGYGLPALEALEQGIPTIVHKDSGVSEILSGTQWAELVDGDNGSLARAIGNMWERIEGKLLDESRAPRLPTNSEWAEAVSRACGWTGGSVN